MTATKERVSNPDQTDGNTSQTNEIEWREEGKFKGIPEYIGYVNGIPGYHLVKYSDKGWYAFFRPRHWQLFGNTCAKYHSDSMCYPKVEQAMEAASQHLSAFGFRPNSYKHL